MNIDAIIAQLMQPVTADKDERRRQALMAAGAGLLSGANRGFFPALELGATAGLNQAQEYDQSVRRDQLANAENAWKAMQMQRWQQEQTAKDAESAEDARRTRCAGGTCIVFFVMPSEMSSIFSRCVNAVPRDGIPCGRRWC